MTCETSPRVEFGIALNVTWQDGFKFGDATDTSWNLTGRSFQMAVKGDVNDTVPLLLMTTANGRIVITDSPGRVIYFNVPPTDLQTMLVPGNYVCDLIMSYGSPAVLTPMFSGTICAENGVT